MFATKEGIEISITTAWSLTTLRQVRSPSTGRPVLERAELSDQALLLFEGELLILGREYYLTPLTVLSSDVLPVSIAFALRKSFRFSFPNVEAMWNVFERSVEIDEENFYLNHTRKLGSAG